MGELVVLPALGGGFDRLLAACHEVPVDKAPAVGGIAAQQHHAGRLGGGQRDGLARGQYDQMLAGHRLGRLVAGCERDVAVDGVDAALDMLRRNLQARARFHFERHIERAAVDAHRRLGTERIAGDHRHPHARQLDARQGRARVVVKRRRVVLMRLRQCHPGLDAVEARAGFARGLWRAFGMGDAAARGHPVHVAGPDYLLAAQAVPVHDLALEQIGHGGQADMRMRAHVDAVARCHRHRPHMIEEDERPYGLGRGGWQQAADGDIAEVPDMGFEQVFDNRH